MYGSSSRISSLDYLEPVLRGIVQNILEDAAAADTPLLVFETFRSEARQQMLFQQHATELRTVGVHNYGLAVDLVKNIGGDPSWKGSFDFLGVQAKKYNLVWGGSWKGFVDSCHLQRCSVADQTKLFNGSWYPSDTYNPLVAGST
jgi:hypothetical protein